MLYYGQNCCGSGDYPRNNSHSYFSILPTMHCFVACVSHCAAWRLKPDVTYTIKDHHHSVLWLVITFCVHHAVLACTWSVWSLIKKDETHRDYFQPRSRLQERLCEEVVGWELQGNVHNITHTKYITVYYVAQNECLQSLFFSILQFINQKHKSKTKQMMWKHRVDEAQPGGCDL